MPGTERIPTGCSREEGLRLTREAGAGSQSDLRPVCKLELESLDNGKQLDSFYVGEKKRLDLCFGKITPAADSSDRAKCGTKISSGMQAEVAGGQFWSKEATVVDGLSNQCPKVLRGIPRGKSTSAKTCKTACYFGSLLTRRLCARLSITGSSNSQHMAAGAGGWRAGQRPAPLYSSPGRRNALRVQRAGLGKCLDLRGGQGTTPRLFPRGGTPQTSLPSPPPLKKRVKKSHPPPPRRGGAFFSLAGVCSPGACGGFRDPPGYAGSSPVPGAAESRTSVTWIFTHQEGATPAFPARSDWNPRSPLARAPRQVCCPVTHSSPRRSPARFPERLGEPSRREFFWLLEGAAGEEPRRWMLLSCAAHASCERSRRAARSPGGLSPAAGRGPRGALLPCGGGGGGGGRSSGHASPSAPPRLMRRVHIAARTGTPAGLHHLAPRPCFGLGECWAIALGLRGA
nr:uncharacterized protein LOC116156313 [Camelus dromedarius]